MAKTTELELAIRIAGKVDPSLQAAVRMAQRQVSTLSGLLGTAGRVGLAAMGVGLAATVKGLADCVKEAQSFESQMAPVVRYVDGLADSMGKVSDATAKNGRTFKENYGAMADYIQDLSTKIPRTTEQLATMSAALGQSGKGVDVQLHTSILQDTATAATAMDLDDETAGQYMAKWEAAFNYSHDEVMTLMDQINYLGAKNATTAAEIAQSVNQAASMGQIAGLDPAATAALATAMQATGVATDRVGTSISRMYVNLSKGASATKAQKEMFEELGLSAEGVAAAMQGDGVGTLLQVFNAIKQLPDERKVAALSTLFGQWAIEGSAKVVNNMDVYEQALAAMQDPAAYTGSMQREFIIQASTGESIDLMTGNAKQVLLQDMGEQLLPVKKQFSLLAIDVMNGIRENLPQLQTLMTTVADLATKGVTVLGDAVQSAMPYIQKGLDYLNQNGEKVAKILAGLAGAFAAMSLAPQGEMAARGVVGIVKGGAGLFGSAVGGVRKAGGGLLGGVAGGLGTLGSIISTSNAYGAMNGMSTTGVLAKLALGALGQTGPGRAVTGAAGAAKSLFGNAVGFGKAQWGLASGLANGALAGVSGLGQWINAALGRASSGGALVPGGSGALGAPGWSAAAPTLAGAGRQILGGLGGMASNAFGGVSTLVGGAMPFLSGFGGILSGTLPGVAVIGSMVAAVSLLKDHLDDVKAVIGQVFGAQGVTIFEGFLTTLTNVKDRILGLFSPTSLNGVRTSLVNLFGGNEGVGVAFDNLVHIGQSVVGVFKQIADFGTGTVKPMFEQVFGWVSTTLLPGLLNAFNAIAPTIGPLVTSIGTAVMSVAKLIGNALLAALPVIENIIMFIVNAVAVVAPPIIQAATQIFGSITSIIGSLQGVFSGLIEFVTGVFTGNWQQAWDGVKQIFGNAFDALVELCKIPINAVIGVINGAVSGINKILGSVTKIPDWVPVVGGKDFNLQLPTIPLLAKGGFTNGVSIAGEAGTEAVISFDPAYRARNLANWQRAGRMLGVEPADLGSGAGRSSGGASFTFSPNITIEGSADYDTVAAALAEAKAQFEQWFDEKMRRYERTAYAR